MRTLPFDASTSRGAIVMVCHRASLKCTVVRHRDHSPLDAPRYDDSVITYHMHTLKHSRFRAVLVLRNVLKRTDPIAPFGHWICPSDRPMTASEATVKVDREPRRQHVRGFQ